MFNPHPEDSAPAFCVEAQKPIVWIKGCNTSFDNGRSAFAYLITTKSQISFAYLQSWPILGLGKLSTISHQRCPTNILMTPSRTYISIIWEVSLLIAMAGPMD